MKTIIGSAIGVAAIGLIVIFAGLRGSASTAPAGFPASYVTSPNGASPVLVSNPSAQTAAAGPVMINCAPGQRALVRQVSLNGEPVSQVACVADPTTSVAAYEDAPVSRVAQPVSYRAPRASAVSERRVVYQEPAPRRTVVEKERSSWKKPLLVIGGSTAAGAGIGGLVGGKKGALIGAALGGGASTLWEAAKR